MDIQPIHFVTKDTNILVKFKNEEDEFEYFPGTVKEINYFATDDKGGFVNCLIQYEDGEEVKDSVLYNCDFENILSDETWKFASNMSLLVKYLIETNEEIRDLKDFVIKEYDSDISEPEPPKQSCGFGKCLLHIVGCAIPALILYLNLNKFCVCPK